MKLIVQKRFYLLLLVAIAVGAAGWFSFEKRVEPLGTLETTVNEVGAAVLDQML